MSEGAGPELRDALVVCSDERAPYNLIIVIISVECGAEECGANFHAVIFCVMESDWFGSNRLKLYCLILIGLYVVFALQSLWSDADYMNLNLLVHYIQELGVTESRDWSINSVLSRGC